MKAFLVSKRLISVLSLLLAIMMLFAACGPDENASQTSDPDDTQSSTDDVADNSDDTQDDTQNNNDDGDDNTPSKQQGGSQTGNQSGNTSGGSTTTNGKNDAFNNSQDGTFYKSAPKGDIHILMWRQWHKTEKQLISQYTKLTGVKIKTTVIAEKDYATKLITMVTGKNSPDVVCLQANNFPGLVTKALQPLDPKTFQLDSDCWSKSLMDAFKINGRYFGAAMPGSWSCEDLNYVTYYSPSVLKSIGVTTMPYELYRQGKWNWETQSEIARKGKAANKTGIAIQGTDLFMHTAGQDFVSYDGKQFTNLIKGSKVNSLLTSAWTEVAELNADKCLSGWSATDVQQGKVALFSAIAYGLYNEGNWFTANFAKTLEAVPMAGPKGSTAYTPIRPKTWGVPKNAKNAKGAAYFIRYFLDTSAFNFSSTTYTKQFEDVFNIVTKPSTKKSIIYGWGVADYVTPKTYDGYVWTLQNSTPQNIASNFASIAGTLNSPIAKANKDLKKIK